jgi:hypothetical protein
VTQPDLRDQGFPLIEQFPLPFRSIKPCKLSIDPDTRVRNITASVQFLSYVRPIDIAEIIALIKIDQETTIS